MKKLLLTLTLLAASMSLAGQQTLTVAVGTNLNNWVPLSTGKYWSMPGSRAQVMYPADSLTAMIGSDITSMKFYVNRDGGMYISGGKYSISLGTTTQNQLFNFAEGLTTVATNISGPEPETYEIEMAFDEPFTYTGGNLIYEFLLTEAGEQTTYITDFLGVRNSDAPYNLVFLPGGQDPIYTNQNKFIPQTTFSYGKVFVTARSLDFGKLLPNTQGIMKVKVKNIASTPIMPVVSGLSAPFSSDYTPTTLASGATLEIPITFAPTALGDFTSQFTIQCGEFASYEVALKGKATRTVEINVCNGTDKAYNLPIHGNAIDQVNTFSQMLYPADMLSAVAGHKIKRITFYPTTPLQWSKPTLTLSLKETDQSEFGPEVTGMTAVSNAQPDNGDTELTFELNEPFAYNGNNCAVQVQVTRARGNYGTYFYGEKQSVNTGYCKYYIGNYGELTDTELVQFLPKMTIVFGDDLTLVGDINDDDKVDISDVNAVINMMLGKAESTPAGDVTGDSKIDISDVNAVINIMLGK